MNYFNYNGKIYKERTPVIGPNNRGLRYGDGLFETMKMKKGKLIFGDEHFARLWRGMKILKFALPKHFTMEVLQDEIWTLAKKNHHDDAARIRLNIIRGDGGLYDLKNHLPNYLIQTWPLTNDNSEWNSIGLVLGIYEGAKKSCDMISNLKHNNFLPYALAALEAKNESWDDAIVLNTEGRICDTTIANIFIVKDNIVYSPSLSEGCVAGVMRGMVINYFSTTNRKVVEKELITDSLKTADEVFITNSLFNIRWVQYIGDSLYQNTISRKIYDSISKTFS